MKKDIKKYIQDWEFKICKKYIQDDLDILAYIKYVDYENSLPPEMGYYTDMFSSFLLKEKLRSYYRNETLIYLRKEKILTLKQKISDGKSY